MKRFFNAVTWCPKGWMVQPAERIERGWWKYQKPIAGPFRTKREAMQWKRDWEALPW